MAGRSVPMGECQNMERWRHSVSLYVYSVKGGRRKIKAIHVLKRPYDKRRREKKKKMHSYFFVNFH